MNEDWQARYGPFALIAGASLGLCEAFARQLASKGLKLLLLARGQAGLDALAAELRALHGIVPWMDRRMLGRHPGWAASMKRRPGLWPTSRSWRSARTGS